MPKWKMQNLTNIEETFVPGDFGMPPFAFYFYLLFWALSLPAFLNRWPCSQHLFFMQSRRNNTINQREKKLEMLIFFI